MCLRLIDKINKSPICTITSNCPSEELFPGQVIVKTYSENGPMRDTFLGSGYFRDTGRRIPSGFVKLEVWDYDRNKFK